MNRLSISAAVLLGISAAAGAAEQNDALLSEACGRVKQFGGQLKGEVAAGMKAGGPVATIEVCPARAPAVARKTSASSGWDVAGTSLKLRNANNATDDREQEALEQFEARKATGEPVAQLEYAETLTSADGWQYRHVKAIGTEQVCRNCHAAEIKPGVEAKLGALYPRGRARGFAVGDIRGAFTLRKDL